MFDNVVIVGFVGGMLLVGATPTGVASAASAFCAEYAEPVQFPGPEVLFDWTAALDGEEVTLEMNGGTATTVEIWGLDRSGIPRVVPNPSTIVFPHGPPLFNRVRIAGRDGTVTVLASCNSDGDDDGLDADVDNCGQLSNSDQADLDGDGRGDRCDFDIDGDGQANSAESQCGSDPLAPGDRSADLDMDDVPDCVDSDVVAPSTTTAPEPEDADPSVAATTVARASSDQSGQSPLPDTGRRTGPLAVTAFALTTAGAALTLVCRRRSPRDADAPSG